MRRGSQVVVAGRQGGVVNPSYEAIAFLGEWELRLWREDAAGNQQADNASQPVRLRFDPEPPQLGFENPSVEDPTHVSVLVTDRISGLAGGGIEISRAGSGSWQVLPTSPLTDQSIAGAIMTVEGMFLTLGLGAWLLLRWAKEDTARQDLLDLAQRHGVPLTNERARRAAAAGEVELLRSRIERQAGAAAR